MISFDRCAPLLFLLLWSSGAIFVKLGLEDAPVSVFLALRAAGAMMALGIGWFWLVRQGRLARPSPLPRSVLGRVMITGVLLQVVYQAAYFLALDHHLTPGVLALILGLQPILTPVLARETIGKAGYGYLCLGLVGLAVALWGARDLGAVTIGGLVFGLASVLAITVGSILQKNSTLNPVMSGFYQAVTATGLFLIVLPFTELRLTVTPQFVLSVSWMAIVVSTLAVVLLFRLLEKGSASQVSVLFYLVPLVTLSLDYLVFGNTVSWVTAFGALLVVVAVRGFGQRRRAAPEQKPAASEQNAN
ncbi:DMT family transporter [Pseudomonas sp. 22-AL-CL-001]|uniref:DMT family transporter n=1 Tax=Pseudomonas alabamensis TaxID=3064349 RepID=UPI002713FE34|nr:DMT family transporter [Pseudomonas sp. 22-AL-CL-001]MDO7910905.1 DMT family transporter [Pseudomonas sp. 22-AL-CL-001]